MAIGPANPDVISTILTPSKIDSFTKFPFDELRFVYAWCGQADISVTVLRSYGSAAQFDVELRGR
ncbi:hypothetical protein A0W34_30040 (plasmid) [Rhodococcus sp. BH4]|nr:hypothetical protein A0W34_30040 [Rhodococcus sp. BH4]